MSLDNAATTNALSKFGSVAANTVADAISYIGQWVAQYLLAVWNQQIEDEKRSSLVQAYAEKVYNEFAKLSGNVRAIVVTVSNLPVEINNLDYIGNETIGNWGYTVYIGYQGSWIKNNGGRGFINWCVTGQNHQTDNIIYVD